MKDRVAQFTQVRDDLLGALEKIRQHISQDPFARFLGIELLELHEGYSKTALTIEAHMLNFHGLPHGGVIFSLADAAFAAACNSYGQVAVALHVDVSFLAAVEVGTRLTAEAMEEQNPAMRSRMASLATKAALAPQSRRM